MLGAELFEHRETGAITAFLRSLDRKHDLADAVFLVDGYGYLAALARLDLSGLIDYSLRNHIEKWFHTLRMRIDRFHASWVGSQASAQQWLAVFVEWYNRQRPHQALNHRTPPEKVLNYTVPTIYYCWTPDIRTMYENILVPTDGTRGSKRAVEHAVALADEHGARLHALYVIDEDVYSSYGGDEYVHEQEGLGSALEQVGEDALVAVETEADATGVSVTSVLAYGVPHEAILDYVEDHDVDLAMMGTEERTGDYRRLLGSVTERVARHASVPVTIVKTPEREE